MISYFRHSQDDLNENFSVFSADRVKRGAVDIVGNLANSLFGVLDSNYEAKMSNIVKELKADDQHLERLLKTQTSLIDSTINIIKRKQLENEAKFAEIEKRIQALLVDHAWDQQKREIHLANAMSTFIIQMFIAVSDLQKVQNNIIDVLTDSHHGKISPLLLTPQQLRDEIARIKLYLPQQMHLPMEEDDLLQIYKLLTISGTVSDNHVIFNIGLPLANNKRFQLFNVAPIAYVKNQRLITIKTQVTLMAISLHRDEFFVLTKATLNLCLKLKAKSYLCQQIQSSYHDSSGSHGCEIALFNKNKDTANCEFQVLKDSTVWYQLNHPNQWVFATNHTTTLNAVCGSEASQVIINGSGIIQVNPECVLKGDTITIQGHREFRSSVTASYKQVH